MRGYRDNENTAALDGATATRLRFGFARRMIARWRLFEMKSWQKTLCAVVAMGVASWTLIDLAIISSSHLLAWNLAAGAVVCLVLGVIFGVLSESAYPE